VGEGRRRRRRRGRKELLGVKPRINPAVRRDV
jgi:hypothetical protein